MRRHPRSTSQVAGSFWEYERVFKPLQPSNQCHRDLAASILCILTVLFFCVCFPDLRLKSVKKHLFIYFLEISFFCTSWFCKFLVSCNAFGLTILGLWAEVSKQIWADLRVILLWLNGSNALETRGIVLFMLVQVFWCISFVPIWNLYLYKRWCSGEATWNK